jgi:hypothetical protein
MSLCVLFKSCLVMRKKVLHLQLHVSVLLSSKTYPVTIFCGEFPPFFLRTFFVLGKERSCQKFSFMREKKIAKKRIQIS